MREDIKELTENAYRMVEEGELREALTIFKQICDCRVDDADAWMMIGAINGELGHIDEGIDGLEKAISIDPGYATAHQWYGELLAVEGQFDAALDQANLARQADPLSPIIPFTMGWFLLYSDRQDESFAYINEALDIDPHFATAIGNLVVLNIMTGRYDQARARCNQNASLENVDPTTELAVIAAVENPALTDQALQLLIDDKQMPDGTLGKALYLMLINKPELAMDYLEKAFEAGDSYAIHIKRMGIYAPLHDKPRFQALLAKMNMWP